ncbi:MAG: protein kinase [Streptomycetaceae bacterium]|nr:protein kinase [Streptomycetaceae bacterium]
MVGRVLAGRYELVALLGRGGMGEVWLGHDRVISRRVAVKLLPSDRRDIGAADLFLREARTAGRLNHPGVVTVHDLGTDPEDGMVFLVMEFLEGRDLATVLHEDGPPAVATAADWAAQAAATLAVAHAAGVVHRDLKPGNLLRMPGGRVKVLDFGIARFVDGTNKSSQVMGTLAYMPPERFDEHPGDARSDLYALGCVIHELLTGKTPFEATGPVSMMNAHLRTPPTPPSELRPEVPAALDALVGELLAKDPADRPETAEAVRDRLQRIVADSATPHRSTAGGSPRQAPSPASVPEQPRHPEAEHPPQVPTAAAAPPAVITPAQATEVTDLTRAADQAWDRRVELELLLDEGAPRGAFGRVRSSKRQHHQARVAALVTELALLPPAVLAAAGMHEYGPLAPLDDHALEVHEIDLREADLEGADLRGVRVFRSDLTAARLAAADLSHASLLVTELARATLVEAVLRGAGLVGVNLSGADLTGADLTDSSIGAARLSGAILHGANLAEALISGDCDFRDADLRGTDLGGATACVDQDGRAPSLVTVLSGALWDAATRWPDDDTRDLAAARSARTRHGFRIR